MNRIGRELREPLFGYFKRNLWFRFGNNIRGSAKTFISEQLWDDLPNYHKERLVQIVKDRVK